LGRRYESINATKNKTAISNNWIPKIGLLVVAYPQTIAVNAAKRKIASKTLLVT
jgi:hypothetical protein